MSDTAVPPGLPTDLPEHLRPAQDRIYEALAQLDPDAWHFDYRDPAVFAMRVWPGVAADTIIVTGLDHALGRRDVFGVGEVWTDAGTVERMVREIIALGEPALVQAVDQRNLLSLAEQTELTKILWEFTEPGSEWRALPSPAGVTITRGWPDESADTAFFASPDTAYAMRENSAGREVWGQRGTAQQIAAALKRLPAPGEPGAPDGTDHTPGRSDRWGD